MSGPGAGPGTGQRQIPKDFVFNPKALKPLVRMLWALSVALGHSLTALRNFTRVKSASISPDGQLGGRGYVMPVDEVRARLFQACEAISAVSDTIHDEINAPHWKPKLGELGANEAEDIHRMLEEAARILSDPEQDAEDEIETLESENDGPGGTSDEVRWGDTPEGQAEDPASDIPGGGANTPEKVKPTKAQPPKTASSLPVDLLPGGPRVNDLDRGNQTGPGGSFNRDEPPSDGWRTEPLPTPGWGHNLAEAEPEIDHLAWKAGESAMPTDTSPSDANDFGLGYGAGGAGLNHGPGIGLADSALPNDDKGPVSRSDYYQGPKGGVELGESGLPGDSHPSGNGNLDTNTPNTGYRHRAIDNPYLPRPSSPADAIDPTTRRLEPLPMSDLGDLTSFIKEGNLVDLDWLKVDGGEYRVGDILPEQNLDIAPDLQAAWAHEDKPSSVYFVENTNNRVKRMRDASSEHGPVTRQEVERTARLALMQSPDVAKFQATLLSRFPRESLSEHRSVLAGVLAERGLLGGFYLAASDFPGCASGRSETPAFVDRHARRAQFVVRKAQCDGCTHARSVVQGGKTMCSVFKKELVVEVPYSPQLAEAVERTQRAAGKIVQAAMSRTGPKERIRFALLSQSQAPQVQDSIKPIEAPVHYLMPAVVPEPIVMATNLTRERQAVMDLVDWAVKQGRMTVDEVHDAAWQAIDATDKSQLVTLASQIEALEQIAPRQYDAPLAADAKPPVTAEAMRRGFIDAGNLMKKRDEETRALLAAEKAKPVVALLRRELLKGRGESELRVALRLGFDPRDLVATREHWEPLFREAGLYGVLYATQESFSDCRQGADFLSKHLSPVKAMVMGPKCSGCIYNKVSRCVVYGKPLVASVDQVLTRETVARVVQDHRASGRIASGAEQVIAKLSPREALQTLHKLALAPKYTATQTEVRTEIHRAHYSPTAQHQTDLLTRRNVVRTASRLMNEGLYGAQLGEALRQKFDPRDLTAAREDLRPLVAEQGLQGVYYIDPSVYGDYGKGCDEATRLHRSSTIAYLKVGSKCSSCVQQTSPGFCTKLNKKLAHEPPYVDKQAQRRAILASGPSTAIRFEDLVNNEHSILAEFQMQQEMVVDYGEAPAAPEDMVISFGEGEGLKL